MGGAAGGGEGADPRARRAGRQAPPDAADGRREGLPLRGPGRPGEPARPVRGAPPADRLPVLLRARGGRLARERLPRLLPGRRRSGRPPRPSQRPRHHARVRVARPAGGHRALEGAHGLAAIPWYTLTDDFDADFGVDEWHGNNAFFRDGDEDLPHLLRQQPRRRGAGQHLGPTSTSPRSAARRTWEDSPEGYPQSEPYGWWNLHDEYEDATVFQAALSDAAASQRGSRGSRS